MAGIPRVAGGIRTDFFNVELVGVEIFRVRALSTHVGVFGSR